MVSQRVPKEDSHDVDRCSVRGEDVHVVCSVEQLFYAVTEQRGGATMSLDAGEQSFQSDVTTYDVPKCT